MKHPISAHDSELLPRTQAVVQTPPPSDATNRVLVRPMQEPSELGTGWCLSDERAGGAIKFPTPGDQFLGFRLTEELGRGAFGRVFLATQGDLAGRAVALKVAPDIFSESQTLAQLQHTNIVPIYSFHRAGAVQAVCMPFFGRTTLVDVLRYIRGRASLPGSGREFVSTVNRRASETAPSARSDANQKEAPPVQVPALRPHPVGVSPDGWGKMEAGSFPEAVLWLAGQLADGLGHAHDRGILHRDLKPANVLLTETGVPMLLDFNLAEDTKTRNPGERAAVGGTLPYMAPEHIRAFRDRAGVLDPRCDLFSLGVILFELLTGRHPYPTHPGPLRESAESMLADREKAPPSPREWNKAIPHATAAIVRKCLAPNPADRYQTAAELREDIDRQLSNRPLKFAPNSSPRERVEKWARRHPRLTSAAAVGAFAAALLVTVGGGAIYARERVRDHRAQESFVEHQAGFAETRLAMSTRDTSLPRLEDDIVKLRGVLARYGIPDDGRETNWAGRDDVRRLPPDDRDRLRADIGETFYLMAQVAYLRAVGVNDAAERTEYLEQIDRWNAAAARYAGDQLPLAIHEQRAALADLRGDREEAARLRREGLTPAAGSPRDLYLLGLRAAHQSRYREAEGFLRESTLRDPKNFSAWFVRGVVHLYLEQHELAAVAFGACLAIRDDFAPAWINRGIALGKLRLFDRALDDFDRAIALDPDLPDGYIQRAIAWQVRGDLPGAEADYTLALKTGNAPVRVYFLRANVRELRGGAIGAKADRERGLSLTPPDELSWVGRAEVREATDPKGALADVEEALKLNPRMLDALQMKAHLLDVLNRPAESMAVLNRVVDLYPDSAPARAGRGVLLARSGETARALRDAADALVLDTRAPNQYQVACIYALTIKANPAGRAEALRLLRSSLTAGFGLDIVDMDSDLDPLRNDPEFKRVVARAKELEQLRKRP